MTNWMAISSIIDLLLEPEAHFFVMIGQNISGCRDKLTRVDQVINYLRQNEIFAP